MKNFIKVANWDILHNQFYDNYVLMKIMLGHSIKGFHGMIIMGPGQYDYHISWLLHNPSSMPLLVLHSKFIAISRYDWCLVNFYVLFFNFYVPFFNGYTRSIIWNAWVMVNSIWSFIYVLLHSLFELWREFLLMSWNLPTTGCSLYKNKEHIATPLVYGQVYIVEVVD